MRKREPKARDPLQRLHRLRSPGDSTWERAFDLWLDGHGFWLLLTGMVFVIFVMDLVRAYTNAPPIPWFWLGLLLVCVIAAIVRIRKVAPKLRAARLGYQGEKAVGQLLESSLRPLGYHVFHDLEIKGRGNIDHALIGPAGVFAVETKTISMPSIRPAKITYDGHRLACAAEDGLDTPRGASALAQT